MKKIRVLIIEDSKVMRQFLEHIIGLDPRLSGAAGYSVLAHLEDMTARGEVVTDGPPSISGVYRLAGS